MRQLEQSRRRIAEAGDLERARIERDLHDGAQQRLMMLRIRLSLVEEQLRPDSAAGADAVHDLGNEAERTLDELRSLAHGVYPAILERPRAGGGAAQPRGHHHRPLHLQTGGLTRLPIELETAVYFTCLEAVQNAIKHAPSASAVWVRLHQSADALSIEVRDDGPGFTAPRESASGSAQLHAGLRNMRDRLEAVGGWLTIDSAPGRGTRVIGRVPLDSDQITPAALREHLERLARLGLLFAAQVQAALGEVGAGGGRDVERFRGRHLVDSSSSVELSG